VRLGSIRDNILLRLELVLLYIMILLIFTTARHVDVIELSDIELYPFYYLLVQPMTTWVAISVIVFMVMLSSRSSYRLVAVLSLAFIIEFLPSFMMVNPWLPDQYPYLSEAYWIYLHGKISDVHRLSTVPGLGLLYGIFEIIINLDPFIISKAFSFVQAIALVVMLAPLSKKLANNEALLPLLFISFNYFAQINVFHRAALHFTYTLVLIYLISTISNNRHLEWRHLLASTVIFCAMVLTYPGSGFVLVSITIAYVLSYIIGKGFLTTLKLLIFIFLVIFGVWYIYTAWSEIRIAGSIWDSLMKVLKLELSAMESATHPYSTGLTPLFKTIVYVRLVIEGGVIAMGFLVASYKYVQAVISYFKREDSDIPFAYTLTLASLTAPAPWLLTEWSRWSFYKFSAYFLLFSLMSLVSYTYSQYRPRRSAKTLLLFMRISAIFIITIALLLVPLLRYASIPYLHVTTSELFTAFFVHEHFTFEQGCYYFEYPPYVLPRLIVHREASHEISFMYWFENISLGLYVLTDRALTREGFYVYPQPLQEKLRELENYMIIRGSKVYDSKYNRIYYLYLNE
jgi:hypothetical protein